MISHYEISVSIHFRVTQTFCETGRTLNEGVCDCVCWCEILDWSFAFFLEFNSKCYITGLTCNM